MARHIDECRKHGIFFSFTCDPLIMETRCLTLRAIYHCVENGIPVWLLTKDATFSYDPDWMSAVCEEFTPEQKAMTHFGFTLTGRDDMEPGASTNDGRILAMSRVKQAGFKTWASIEPVIDWDSADKVVIGSLDYCDHYKIGLRSGVKRDYYNPQESTERIFRLVYTITSNDRTVYADFLEPGSLNLSLGMDYDMDWMNHKLKGTIHLAPIAYNLKYTRNLDLSTRLGIKEGRHALHDYGSLFTADLTWEFNDMLKWKTRMYGYTTYKNAVFEWENTFVFQLNKWLAAQLFVYPRFDDNVSRDDKHGYWQFKEFASIGFNYSF